VPIMQGTVALRAWRALPSAVRREAVTLARQGVPHPDPSVVRAALAAARAAQTWYFVVFAGLAVAVTAGALVFRAAFWTRTPAGFTAYVVLLGWILVAVLVAVSLLGAWGIWPSASVHLGAAGVRELVARRPVAAAAPLTVPAAPRRWRLLLPSVEWMSIPAEDVLAAIRDHLAARTAASAEG